MTDRQLECIVAIANHGSITSAAKQLIVSQSSLSQLLGNLEKELGVQLFSRATSPLVPTYAGDQVLKAAGQILEIKQSLMYKLEDLNHSCRGRITIGTSQKRSSFFMPIVLSAYMKQCPEVEISFIEEDQKLLEDMVMGGKVDLAFTTHPRWADQLDYQYLYREYLMLALPSDHPLCSSIEGTSPLNLSLTSGIPFILIHEGHDIRAMCNQAFSDFGMRPNILLESHSMDVCFQMAACGLGATIIPDTLVKGHPIRGHIKCFHIGRAYSREVAIAYRKNMYLPFIMKEFISIATEQIIAKYQNDDTMIL